MILGRRIKAARVLAGCSVESLATRLGLSPQKIYRLERGDQVPDALLLANIARETGQPLEFFLGDTSSDRLVSEAGDSVKEQAAAIAAALYDRAKTREPREAA